MGKITLRNITHLSETYGPGYVARDKKTGRVVAHASRVDVLVRKVKKKRESVVISWIPKHGARYVFNFSLRLLRS